MGLLRRLFEKRTGHPSLAAIFGVQSNSYAGVAVTEETALTYSAVFAAIRLLSWSAAMLPLLTYRRQTRGKVRADDHPLYTLLKEQANPEMTAFEFRSTIMGHAVGRGNGYAEIEWSNAGEPLALWPLNPARMKPERANNQLRYLYDLPDGSTANLPAWRVHHIKGLSGNGLTGYSPIRMAMQAIGLGLATEEFGSRFFGNGARPGVILRHPGVLSDNAHKRLRESWSADHQGLSNAHRMRILEEGMDIQTVGIPPEEAQFLQTRQFQITEVARWFNVPPHMIADMSGATFSNIEEQGVEFVTYSLGPWLTNIEQALARDLLTQPEQRALLIEHLVDGLLRGRTAERFTAYQSALQGGWMSPNEVRERENLNPYDGGDTYLLPLNMAPADQAGARAQRHTDLPDCTCAACRAVSRETRRPPMEEQERRARGLAEDRRQIMQAYVPLYEEVAQRMVKREVQDIRRALDKSVRRRTVDDFFGWLEEYYKDYRSVLADAFRPLMLSLAQLLARQIGIELDLDVPTTQDELADFVGEYLEDFAEGTTAGSRNQLLAFRDEAAQEEGSIQDYVVGKIEERLEEWLEKKAIKIAARQAFQAGNGLVVANYTVKGVKKLVWDANGGACAFCAKLDGKIIGIEEWFATAGQMLIGGNDDAPMIMRSNKRHGPIHGGCECTVRAGK